MAPRLIDRGVGSWEAWNLKRKIWREIETLLNKKRWFDHDDLLDWSEIFEHPVRSKVRRTSPTENLGQTPIANGSEHCFSECTFWKIYFHSLCQALHSARNKGVQIRLYVIRDLSLSRPIIQSSLLRFSIVSCVPLIVFLVPVAICHSTL